MRNHDDLAYVDGGRSRQKLDLYVPDAGKKIPLVIWIHGGAFRAGSKKDHVPVELLDRGFAVASVNYRLSREAPFPAQIEDVKSAIRWLRANAKRFGIDPDRIAIWGESAGGYLAALAGATGGTGAFDAGEHLDVASGVQAVIDYSGPTDFLKMDSQRIPGGMSHDAPDSPESELLGGAIQLKKDLAARANPVAHLTKDAPPFLIVHGDRDPFVPYGQSLLLKDALLARGVPVVLHTVEGAGHGNFHDPAVTAITLEFLDRWLKPRACGGGGFRPGAVHIARYSA